MFGSIFSVCQSKHKHLSVFEYVIYAFLLSQNWMYNILVCDFRTTSKEAKRMVCDCFLTKDEIVRGEMGCGEDCLNRLLMIEW
jgi:hypothetical protein